MRASYALHNVSQWWSNYWGPIRESFAQAWQKNITVVSDKPTLLTSSAVFCCVTGISNDIAKLRIKLVQDEDGDDVWEETENPAYSPVLRKPNHFQTRNQFIRSWIVSKLLYGNAYVLKERDNRGVVVRLYVLHPLCVTPLQAEDGSVYYQVKRDYLAGMTDDRAEVAIPASEIIHDRMAELWHPLVGVSPLFACAAAATTQAKILDNSMNLFGNRSIPGGILTAPGAISNETASRLKTDWENNFGGTNNGRTAVLGDGLTFEMISMTAEHAQLAEQFGLTVEDVARAFHFPLFKLNGKYPPYDSIQAIDIIYYKDCLQELIENLEACLNEGLSIPRWMSTELDIENLLRMDTVALYQSNKEAGTWMTPNEQRKRANLKRLDKGGDTVYRQEQDHSIETIAERDAGPDPFGKKQEAPQPAQAPQPKQDETPQPERSIPKWTNFVAFTRRLDERFTPPPPKWKKTNL